MPHRIVLLLTAAFVILIGAILLIAPEVYLQLYAADYLPGMDFGVRRFAPAVLGLGALLFLARDLPVGRFLVSLCLLTGLVFWGVAGTGLHAYLTGAARHTIMIAAAVEIVIGAVFLTTSRSLSRSA